MKKKLILLLGTMFVLLSGCDTSPIPFGYVTGTLTIDSKPAPKNMRVNFYPEIKGGSSSIGYTNEKGKFEMEFSLTRKGVEVGTNKVVIENPDGGRPVVSAGILKANNKLFWEQSFEVKKGRQKFNFNIDTSLTPIEEPKSRRNGNRRQQEDNSITDVSAPSDGE
ncbi:MAG: hypothetical protein LBK82_02975 [Planctomycetaceae bacterium]|jgi:hypothetical protein|nr:hypothetical protein [Planctomycetaceae bacterium]